MTPFALLRQASGLAYSGALILALLALAGLFAPLLTSYDPNSTQYPIWLTPDGNHWLGTTALGQDVFAQLAMGRGCHCSLG